MLNVLNKSKLVRASVIVFLVGLLALIFGSIEPNYLSEGNIKGILRSMALNGIVSIGLTFVIVVRKFDLSLPGVGSFAAMTLGFVMVNTGDLTLIIIASIVAGLFFGVLSGALVGLFRFPDVVTTIAIGSISFGAAFIYNGGGTFSENFFSSGMVTLNFKTVLGIQMPVFVLLVTFVLASILLHATRFGNAFYAVGENETASRYSGIKVGFIVLTAFLICGGLVGVAMVLKVSGVGSAIINAGNTLLLPAYTAVYLGAALLGKPSIPATLGGVLLVTMLANGFNLASVPWYYAEAISGAILVAAITVFDPSIFSTLRTKLSLNQTSNVGSK